MCRDQNLISGDERDLVACSVAQLLALSEHMKIEKPGVGRPLLGTAKNPAKKAKFVKNQTFVARRDHFFPFLFPKDLENLKSLDIGLGEVGAKRRINRVNKGKNP